jgi:hypothetical protein
VAVVVAAAAASVVTIAIALRRTASRWWMSGEGRGTILAGAVRLKIKVLYLHKCFVCDSGKALVHYRGGSKARSFAQTVRQISGCSK